MRPYVPKLYLAGPIAGCTDEEANGWRTEAKRLLGDVWRISDPMDRDYRGRETGNERAIVDGDLNAICGTDAVLLNAARASWGTAMEIVYASMWLKRIVAFGTESPSPWLVTHCTEIVPTLEGACQSLLWSAVAA